jgi:hypothetical protein
MAFDALRVASHQDGFCANLPGPTFSSPDKTSSNTATPRSLIDDEPDNFGPKSRFQNYGRMRLQPSYDFFFQNRDNHEVVLTTGDSRQTTGNGFSIGGIAEQTREPCNVSRIGRNCIANCHILFANVKGVPAIAAHNLFGVPAAGQAGRLPDDDCAITGEGLARNDAVM